MNDELLTWHERCGTCAYRPGTEANRSEITLLKAQLCLESGEPFLCHEDPSRRAICKGWADAFESRLKAGKLKEEPERRKMAAFFADLISDAEQSVLRSQAEEAKRLYDAAVARMEAAQEERA